VLRRRAGDSGRNRREYPLREIKRVQALHRVIETNCRLIYSIRADWIRDMLLEKRPRIGRRER